MSGLTPSDWNDLIDRMGKDSTDTLINKYRTYYHRHAQGSCNENCKKGILCGLRTAIKGSLFVLPDTRQMSLQAIRNYAVKQNKWTIWSPSTAVNC